MHPGPGVAGWLLPALLVVVPAAAYLAGTVRLRARLGRRWSPLRTASAVLGLVLLAVALSPPVTAAAHADLRVHVVRHLLLGSFGPLALVLSAPVTLALGASSTAVRRRIGAVLGSPAVAVLSHPVPAAVLSTGGLYLLHATGLFALSMRDPGVGALVDLHLVLAGCLFSWAVAGPDPSRHRASTAVRLAVLVLAGAAHGLLAKLLVAQEGRWPPGTSHPQWQVEAAAQWMYYGGDLAELLLAVALLAGWYRTSGRRRPVAARPARVA